MTFIGSFKETFDKGGKHNGYTIGDKNEVEIHNNIQDPDTWYITCRPLSIFSESLCPKDLPATKVAAFAFQRVKVIFYKAQELLAEIQKYM